MANRPATITQTLVMRVVRGARKAGLRVQEVIATTENVRLVIGNGEATDPENPLDNWRRTDDEG